MTLRKHNQSPAANSSPNSPPTVAMLTCIDFGNPLCSKMGVGTNNGCVYQPTSLALTLNKRKLKQLFFHFVASCISLYSLSSLPPIFFFFIIFRQAANFSSPIYMVIAITTCGLQLNALLEKRRYWRLARKLCFYQVYSVFCSLFEVPGSQNNLHVLRLIIVCRGNISKGEEILISAFFFLFVHHVIIITPSEICFSLGQLSNNQLCYTQWFAGKLKSNHVCQNSGVLKTLLRCHANEVS